MSAAKFVRIPVELIEPIRWALYGERNAVRNTIVRIGHGETGGFPVGFADKDFYLEKLPHIESASAFFEKLTLRRAAKKSRKS